MSKATTGENAKNDNPNIPPQSILKPKKFIIPSWKDVVHEERTRSGMGTHTAPIQAYIQAKSSQSNYYPRSSIENASQVPASEPSVPRLEVPRPSLEQKGQLDETLSCILGPPLKDTTLQLPSSPTHQHRHQYHQHQHNSLHVLTEISPSISVPSMPCSVMASSSSSAHLPPPRPPGASPPPPPVMSVLSLAFEGSNGALIASFRQKGNAVLKYVQAVSIVYDTNLIPDFQIGRTSCAFFLSIKYHRIHPDYIYHRIKSLKTEAYKLRVLLVKVDVDDHEEPIKEITKLCIIAKLVLICSRSDHEIAKYLETYRAYDNKTSDLIQERVEKDYESQLQHVFSSIKGVNKTDVKNISEKFGSLKNLANASTKDLESCSGLGPKKVKRIQSTFSRSFKKKPKTQDNNT